MAVILLLSWFTGAPPPLTVDAAMPVNTESAEISGSTDPELLVAVFRDGNQIANTTADNHGNFRLEVMLADEGEHSFVIQACTKSSKHNCSSAQLVIPVDWTPPLEPVLAAVMPETTAESLQLSGQSEAGSKIVAAMGDQYWQSYTNKNGNFQLEVPLHTGSNIMAVWAEDEAGNVSQRIERTIFRRPPQAALVSRVIDGDTIELSTGDKVRYIGIDTPENTTSRECFGAEATEANRKLVEGKEVNLEKDVSETDRYGRLLRYVYVGETMVNEELVVSGFAYASAYPPDVKYQERFLQAQQQAVAENAGLWGSNCALSEK